MNEQMEAIRKRYAGATPGAWVWESSAGDRIRLWSKPTGDFVLEIGRKPGGYEFLDIDDADARFIGYAREDVEFLLAEVDRLRDLLSELTYDPHNPANVREG